MSSKAQAPKRGFTSLESAVKAETEEIKHLESITYWAMALAVLFVASTCVATAVILTTRPLGVLMGDLVGPDGKPVKTGAHHESQSLLSVASTNFADLAKLETIAFIYLAPGQHDATEVLFHVTKVSRTEGVTLVYGNPQCALRISSTSANYTDTVNCAQGCEVVLTKPNGSGRRSLALRSLAWWNPCAFREKRELTLIVRELELTETSFARARRCAPPRTRVTVSWFSGSNSQGSTPVWKADTSGCPWICRQGYWWESNSYGKPACCVETKNSGSPYDSCQYESCMCDASCRSCCD